LANFHLANLQGANLQGANLQLANLQGADLGWTNLQGADLYGADLQEAILRGSNIYLTKNLSLDQLSKVKTLYNAKLDEDTLKTLKEKYPRLFKKPEFEDEEPDYK
jgi:BTB/POZ domain-containing protein KCTD9